MHPDQVSRAQREYDFYNLNKSITKGRSQIYGALGEIVVFDYYSKQDHKLIHEATYDYDMTINGFTVDVKTKRCTSEPKPNYYASIAATTRRQSCDYYLFVRILEDLSKAWLLGFYESKKFFMDATFNKKGEPDGPQFNFREDCYNLRISELNL